MARKAREWNIWWTLMVISAALTIVAAFLDYVGVIQDLGDLVELVGLVLTMAFGFAAATRGSIGLLRDDIVVVGDKIDTLGVVLERMDQTMSEGFARLERVLIERLPERG